ncbi:hypothetical protein J6590_008460 [Homalodisca vitripennis]|nr:hypothetical protein J6590_008460 [Homalodisca vitripennis]
MAAIKSGDVDKGQVQVHTTHMHSLASTAGNLIVHDPPAYPRVMAVTLSEIICSLGLTSTGFIVVNSSLLNKSFIYPRSPSRLAADEGGAPASPRGQEGRPGEGYLRLHRPIRSFLPNFPPRLTQTIPIRGPCTARTLFGPAYIFITSDSFNSENARETPRIAGSKVSDKLSGVLSRRSLCYLRFLDNKTDLEVTRVLGCDRKVRYALETSDDTVTISIVRTVLTRTLGLNRTSPCQHTGPRRPAVCLSNITHRLTFFKALRTTTSGKLPIHMQMSFSKYSRLAFTRECCACAGQSRFSALALQRWPAASPPSSP